MTPPPAERSTSRVPALSPGDILAGRYQLDRIIGEGGMGVVWAATQITTGRAVAIKALKENDPDDSARFLREARVAASLQHRNIVQVYDLWQLPEEGGLIMVMELLHGESLAQVLLREKQLSWSRTVDIMQFVAAALSSAHERGFVHRDLKPDNIFLAKEIDGEVVVKVLDFGLARPTDRTLNASVTHTGSIMGTPHYMAPEQVFGEKALTFGVDSWAFGVILAECLSGRKLFAGENFGQIFKQITQGDPPHFGELLADVPPELRELVARLVSRDAVKRPNDAEVIATFAGLLSAADGRTSAALRTTISNPPRAAGAVDDPLAPTQPQSRTVQITSTANTVPDARLVASEKKISPLFAAAVVACALLAGIWLAMRPLTGARPLNSVGDTHPTPSLDPPVFSAAAALTSEPAPTVAAPIDSGPPARVPSPTPSASELKLPKGGPTITRTVKPAASGKSARAPLDSRF